jgi:N-acetylmuramoyl-L-alanine amidase
MKSEQKNFLKGFARVSPVFAAAAFALFCSSLPALAGPPARSAAENDSPAAATAATKREAAENQFAKAEAEREALNSKPADKRTLAEYKNVISSYRRVYLISPRAASVTDALFAVGQIYEEMGERFGQTYFQSAVDAYQFLVHEYPAGKHNQDAMLRVAALEKDRLNNPALASKTYQDFQKRYPRSSHRREVQESLAELALLLRTMPANAAQSAPVEAKNSVAPANENSAESAANAPVPLRDGTVARVRRIDTAAATDSARVTIDLEGPVQYTSARIAKPDRIFFDLHAARLSPAVAHENIHVEGDLLKGVRVAQNHAGVVRVVLDVNGVKDYTASLLNNPTRLVIELFAGKKAFLEAKAESSAVPDAPADSSLPSPAKRNSGKNAGRDTTAKPDLITPASTPKPTRDGQSTLTRALGLKIGRIVIDPGHGGHDTGTIGPTGLMEKDLCLDVALRLGKIIQQKLPGAEVIYTRSDDTFIPLEERTRIANEAKADLFISIHANASRDTGARGIETYYLNLKGSPEAMEVAARENATSQEGIHNLQDVVKEIARTEKIDESREFAEDIQDSLTKHIFRTTRTAKNRGVRKAPFVVLIGADMPSILTEISFLSNPWDEKQLKNPVQRQRVAEGLYQGVASYLQSLNSMTLNMRATPVSRRSATDRPLEESRNQN